MTTLNTTSAESKVATTADLTISTEGWNSGVYLVKVLKQNSSKTLQLLKK